MSVNSIIIAKAKPLFYTISENTKEMITSLTYNIYLG
jgi:hypothetical protein